MFKSGSGLAQPNKVLFAMIRYIFQTDHLWLEFGKSQNHPQIFG